MLYGICAHPVSSAVKKPRFWGACQENILDNKTFGTRFDQCLRGNRVLKISVTMRCGVLATCAKIFQ
jgi:hypothetical protein